MRSVPAGAYCDHRRMREHCPGCGHFSCPCGVAWDEGAEGGAPRGFSARVALRLMFRARRDGRAYLRLAIPEAEARERLRWPKSFCADGPGVTVVGIKAWYARPAAAELAAEGIRILRWRAPAVWSETAAEGPSAPAEAP